MKWNLVADSSCDLHDLETGSADVGFGSVPFTISVGNRDFVDDENLDVDEMMLAMERCREASRTSCPPPSAWYEQFERADHSIALTVSGRLSGSYNSALAAQSMIMEKYPDKRVAVVDSLSAGPEIALLLKKLRDLIGGGLDFDAALRALAQYRQSTRVTFALSSFSNLVKGGRMGKLTGFIAGKLGFWGIGVGSEQGTISVKQKLRGEKRALAAILADMKERGGEVRAAVISHCQNIESAQALKSTICHAWSGAEVQIVPVRGLCSYYAERGGLIVGFQGGRPDAQKQ